MDEQNPLCGQKTHRGCIRSHLNTMICGYEGKVLEVEDSMILAPLQFLHLESSMSPSVSWPICRMV